MYNNYTTIYRMKHKLSFFLQATRNHFSFFTDCHFDTNLLLSIAESLFCSAPCLWNSFFFLSMRCFHPQVKLWFQQYQRPFNLWPEVWLNNVFYRVFVPLCKVSSLTGFHHTQLKCRSPKIKYMHSAMTMILYRKLTMAPSLEMYVWLYVFIMQESLQCSRISIDSIYCMMPSNSALTRDRKSSQIENNITKLY